MAARTAIKTLWVGELDPGSDESTLYKYFEANRKQILSVKVMRDKNQLGNVAGYGFVEFQSHDIAAQIMETHVGKPVAGFPGKIYRLNWAQTGGADNPAMRALNTAQQISIFVGDVPAEATDQMLEKIFRDEYGDGVVNARVMMDLTTGRSKGYGFVRFTEEALAQRALIEMQGKYILNRRMRLSGAAKKAQTFSGAADPFPGDGSCTVYIGNLAVTNEDELKSIFVAFGEITRVKIIEGKNCAFVDFFTRSSAETAITQMNGAIIGGMKIRMSWGHTGSAGGPSPPKLQLNDPTIFQRGAFGQANQQQLQQQAYEQWLMQMQQWQTYMEYMRQLQSAAAAPPAAPPEPAQTESEPEVPQGYLHSRLKQFAIPTLAPRLNSTVTWL